MLVVTGMGSPTHATGIAGPAMSPSHFNIAAPVCACAYSASETVECRQQRPSVFHPSQPGPRQGGKS
eukprot:2845796-Rhodomonas_salina.1